MSDRFKLSFLSSNCRFQVSSHVSTFHNGELTRRLRMMMMTVVVVTMMMVMMMTTMTISDNDFYDDDDDDHDTEMMIWAWFLERWLSLT